MSVASTALSALRRHQTRIIAVPLSRPKARHPSSTSLPPQKSKNGGPAALTYYQFQLATKKYREKKKNEPGVSTKGHGEADGGDGKAKSKSWIPEEGVVKWAQNKAAETWAGFGKAEGGWKLKTFQFGERIVDRMDFEELALKSIDPSLGPTITHPQSNEVMSEEGEKGRVGFRIPLIYPPSAVSQESVLSELRHYVEHRIPIHKRGFYTWMIIAPFTAPFMIIPVIPNLPFFFCVWRSWSHFKAYRSSQYLQSLLDKEVIVPEPSETLDAIYKEYAPPPTSSSSSPRVGLPRSTPITSSSDSQSNSEPEHEMLLDKKAVPVILERFELQESAAADMYRALEQARVRGGWKVKSEKAE